MIKSVNTKSTIMGNGSMKIEKKKKISEYNKRE